MKKFESPKMSVQKLASTDILTNGSTDCRVEALGCGSCYCVAVVCDDYVNEQCPDDTDWEL